jgi:outer membrane protein TolC
VAFHSAWEIDVFGRIRNEVKAASANVRSAEENRRDVLLALLGEVARSYADLRGFQLRLEIAEKNIQTQEDTVHLTQVRAAAGLATQLDVARAVAERETTKGVVPSLRSAISASIHRISVLVGQEPGALQRELEASAPVPVVPPEVPVGLSSDLLKRRPDVRRQMVKSQPPQTSRPQKRTISRSSHYLGQREGKRLSSMTSPSRWEISLPWDRRSACRYSRAAVFART